MMLGTGLLAVGALMIWTGLTGQNGFGELVKLFQGEPAFVRDRLSDGRGGSLVGPGPDGELPESVPGGPRGGGGGGGGGAW